MPTLFGIDENSATYLFRTTKKVYCEGRGGSENWHLFQHPQLLQRHLSRDSTVGHVVKGRMFQKVMFSPDELIVTPEDCSKN